MGKVGGIEAVLKPPLILASSGFKKKKKKTLSRQTCERTKNPYACK